MRLVGTTEGPVDLITDLSPLDTLATAQTRFATVVKNRKNLTSAFGQFNMRKTGSPWRDARLRRAANLAINRQDLITYAAKDNGVILPGVLPVGSVGFDPGLAPYPFDPEQARRILAEAGYPDALPVRLIAFEGWEVLATVVSKMLEQVGFKVEQQVLAPDAYGKKVYLSHQDEPAEKQSWDIALTLWGDPINFPVFEYYGTFALDGASDWVEEQPELRRLYEDVMGTIDRERQRSLMQQMERHTHDQAYLFTGSRS